MWFLDIKADRLTNIPTDRYTDTQKAKLRTLTGGEVTTLLNRSLN